MDPLYLKVIDGKPVDHPTFESNLLEVFGRVPKNYVPFTRLPRPPLESKGVFQKFADTYVLSADGQSWEDLWIVKDMDEDQKSELIARCLANPPGPNLTLDTTTLTWNKDIPRPTDGGKYAWNFPEGKWVPKESA